VPPGESPFHIKGVAYLGHLEWVDKHFPGGRPAFMALLSPTMSAYFSQHFLAMKLHDFLPFAAAGHTCARALGMGFVEFVEMRARYQAEIDLNGIYRLLLKLTSPKQVATRLPKLMTQYFDFGNLRVLKEEAFAVKFEVDRLPTLAVDWFGAVYTAYSEIALIAAGGHLPTLDLEVHPGLELHGFAASRLTGIVRWG